MKTKLIPCMALLVWIATGCYKDGPPEVVPQQATAGKGGAKGVFVTNEGNFQFGNASVSYLDLTTGVVTEDLYKQSNGKALGDVCQSMTLFNGKAYLVVNNSEKIEVCNSITLKQEGVILGIPSPRYFLPVSNGKAYVTDLYAHAMYVVDLSNHSVIHKIFIPGSTGPLIQLYGMAYVTSGDSEQLYLVNTRNDQLADSIRISKGANSIRQDCYGKIWVACSSNSKSKTKGALFKIDPLKQVVELKLEYDNLNDSPWRLCINGRNDTLYYLNNGICRLPVNNLVLENTPFIAQGSHNFYGLGVDPVSGMIYAADAMDYVQRGKIYRYFSGGVEYDSFFSGLIPGDFCFQ